MANETVETIGDRIRQRREALGKTPAQVARDCGVTKQAVSQWETGATKAPSGPKIVLLAVSLRVTEHWLATGQGRVERAEALNEDELSLLAKYRRLPARDKATIQTLAESLLPSPLPFTGTT